MAKKAGRNTKARIVSAAWKLFYEQGYEDTTVEDIVFESETSKGSFYHYFDGKDALLGSLSVLFDEKYEELRPQLDPQADAVDTLVFLNQELFAMIDNSVSLELLARLRTDLPAHEIAKASARCERGLRFDWCLCGGEYALSRYSAQMMPMFLQGFRPAQ